MIEFYYYIPQHIIDTYSYFQIWEYDEKDQLNIESPFFDIENMKKAYDDGIEKLLMEINKKNSKFCRDQSAISLDFLKRSILEDITIYMVDREIIHGSKIVGALTLSIINHRNYNAPEKIQIEGLCIPVSNPKKKYGTLLVRKVFELAELLGVNYISLEASPSNCQFYRKLGFRIDRAK